MAFQEQFDRTVRWYERLQDLNAGRTHTMASDNYQDDIYAFFLNCYHLKDWIRRDPSVAPATKGLVESYITSTPMLALCADLCNALKHFTLTQHMSHAGGGHPAGLRALDLRQPLFEHGHGRVAEARILVVLHGAGEGGLRLLGVVIDEAGGQEDRLGRFAMLAAHGAAMHEAGGATEFAGGIGHSVWAPMDTARPLEQRKPGRADIISVGGAFRWPL